MRLAQTGTVARMIESVSAARSAGVEAWMMTSDSETGSDILADLVCIIDANSRRCGSSCMFYIRYFEPEMCRCLYIYAISP